MTVAFKPGAPGLYRAPTQAPRSLTTERMDVCAFVGVAPRGPAWVPDPEDPTPVRRPLVEPVREGRRLRRSVAVPVESWEEYRRIFGGFEGPGMLPYAVRAFFQEGGRRAYVVRVVAPERGGSEARGELPGLRVGAAGPVVRPVVHARSEGRWGDALRVSVALAARPVVCLRDVEGRLRLPASSPLTAQALLLPPDSPLTRGALLRVPDLFGVPTLRFVRDLVRERDDAGDLLVRAELDAPVSCEAGEVELIEATVTVHDGARAEVHSAVGLASEHRRFLASVLTDESSLLWPDASWVDGDLFPLDPRMLSVGQSRAPLKGGADGYAAVTHAHFFDDRFAPGDGEHGDGICAVAGRHDVASLAVPDLYDPRPQVDVALPTRGLGRFELCLSPPVAKYASAELPGLSLDPSVPGDLDAIMRHQQRIVDFAEATGDLVALLDVPPGLHARQVGAWRARLRSSYAAAYHPWLKVAGEGAREGALALLPPSAAAAGIIARKELREALSAGPANETLAGAAVVAERVSPERHDALHQAGINVFAVSAARVWLTGARTLSVDPAYRQLTVRRLMLMLRRALIAQTRWIAFEPHTPALRADIEHMLQALLRGLYRTGSLRGASESEAFFVRCDESLNTRPVVEAGRLVVEVGVAPSEPVEFIVLRLQRDANGAVQVEG